jgi:hypothetical protein
MIQMEKDIRTLTYKIIMSREEITRIKSQDDYNALICRISQIIYKYIKEH